MDMTDDIDRDGSWIGFRRRVDRVAQPALPDGRAIMARVEAYWRRHCSGSLPPYRRDLDAGSLAGALPHLFLLERMAPGVARLRTAGQGISSHLGGEARGLPLSALVSAEARPRLAHWLDRCFDEPALVELAAAARRGLMRPPMAARLLLLPLRDEDGRVTRALGGIFPIAGAMLSNIRFDLHEDTTLRHAPMRGSEPVLSARRPERRLAGLAEPKRSYLRLVVSND
jgi:hypothetical protein